MENVFQSMNLTGFTTLTGKRALTVDPKEAVRTTPTTGKITLSDGIMKEGGFVPGSRVVCQEAPTGFEFPITRTFQEGDVEGLNDSGIYLLAPGYGMSNNGKDKSPSFGNYLSDDAGSGVSFASAAFWSSLQGTTDGSRYFAAHAVYGIAHVDGKFVVVTNENKNTLPADAPCVVWKCTVDGSTIDTANPITVAEALKLRPVYALEYTKYEEKSVRERGEKAEGTSTKEAKAEEVAPALGSDFDFGESDEL